MLQMTRCSTPATTPIRAFDLDDGLTLIIGPTQDARLLEIGVVDGELAPVIVHAMPARDKFLR